MALNNVTPLGFITDGDTYNNVTPLGFAVGSSAAGTGATAVVWGSKPSSGAVNAASTNFNVSVDATPISGTLVVTPATNISGGGTFDPTTVSLTTAAPSSSFTFTPAKSGAHTISLTNNGGLTDPSSSTYTVKPEVTLIFQVTADDATPVASATGIKWAWWDATSPASFVAPTDKGSMETTDGSGVITIPLPNSTKTNGQIGWLVASTSDGTTSQDPPGRSFSGPAAVT